MAYEQRDNSGSLFKNDRKEKPNQPDYTGNGVIDGVEMRLSAWIKEGRKGKFMSLAFTPKDDQSQDGTTQRNAPAQQAATGLDDDSDIPF